MVNKVQSHGPQAHLSPIGWGWWEVMPCAEQPAVILDQTSQNIPGSRWAAGEGEVGGRTPRSASGHTGRCTPATFPLSSIPCTPSSPLPDSPSPFLRPLQREMPGGRVHLSTHCDSLGISSRSLKSVPGPWVDAFG